MYKRQIIDQVRGVADGLKSLTTPAIQFEQSMHDLSAITGSVGDELEELTKAAREVGAESGLGASESARAFSVLAGQIDVPIESLKTLQKDVYKRQAYDNPQTRHPDHPNTR